MSDYKIRVSVDFQDSWKTHAIGGYKYPAALVVEGIGQKGAPDVTMQLEMRAGVPEVVDFRISAKPKGRAVRTADLARWKLETLAVNAFRQHAEPVDSDEYPGDGPKSEAAWTAIGRDLDVAHSRSGGPSRVELEEVARVYREALAEGAGRARPTEAVQTMCNYPSRRTAARRVEQARAAGLLPTTSQGKARS